jgi:hypothetical protein
MSFAAWFEGLPEPRRAELARRFSQAVVADGLVVYKADEDRFLPIPCILTPEAIAPARLAGLARDADLVLRGTIKLCRHLLEQGGGERLMASFTPLEKACLARDPARLARVATARVDYFLGPGDRPQALELNATIPAMQGYSDIIARRWIEAVGAERGLSPEAVARLVARAVRNTADLLEGLRAHYRLLGGQAEAPSILIVSRRGDAQVGELGWYVRAFSAAGHRAEHAFVDEVGLDGEGRLEARGRRWDLLYRHIFARRVEPGSALGRLLLDPGPNVVLNPVVSPLEVKGMLGLLHEALVDAELAARFGLDADELDAVARVVPWTRVLARGAASLPDGSRTDDLAAWATAHGSGLVLKRSWDYGGKSVHLGPETPDWRARVEAAVADDDLWVVQEYVPPRPTRHLLVEPQGPTWRELYVDISAYASHGAGVHPGGGVCRASGSKIVNILGGGGLTPLLPSDVLDELFA